MPPIPILVVGSSRQSVLGLPARATAHMRKPTRSPLSSADKWAPAAGRRAIMLAPSTPTSPPLPGLLLMLVRGVRFECYDPLHTPRGLSCLSSLKQTNTHMQRPVKQALNRGSP